MRVVAATNRDLKADVGAGRFARICTTGSACFPISVPPLRERSEDIAPLAAHFLERGCVELGREPLRLSTRQVQRLMGHHWPGNIRELKNVIERAVILSTGNRARLDLAMPDDPVAALPSPMPSHDPETTDFVTDNEIRALEKANMIAALRHADWQVWGPDGAAELLGIKPSTLTYRMKAHGIRKDA